MLNAGCTWVGRSASEFAHARKTNQFCEWTKVTKNSLDYSLGEIAFE
jgi:guanylate kinase